MVIEKLTKMKKQTNFTPDTIIKGNNTPVEWLIFDQLAEYEQTLVTMRETARQIAIGEKPEQVWLLEHPPLYTSGTSAKLSDLLQPKRFPVFSAGRGGQFTYHGPGQRIAYVMLDLRQRGRDIKNLITHLEGWIIDTLADFNISAKRVPGRVGVWVEGAEFGSKDLRKIAAIGVRVSKWVSFHGISINISPDLSHYEGIIPCGISDHGVTSFEDIGQLAVMAEIDIALRKNFEQHFGPTLSHKS